MVPRIRSCQRAAVTAVGVAAALAACGGIAGEPRDEHAMTALMRAADGGDLAEAERLVAAGADVKAVVPTRELREFVAFISWMQTLPRWDVGYTPLHYAARGGHAGIVRLLIARGADVHHKARDGDGKSVLEYAARYPEAQAELRRARAR